MLACRGGDGVGVAVGAVVGVDGVGGVEFGVGVGVGRVVGGDCCVGVEFHVGVDGWCVVVGVDVAVACCIGVSIVCTW